MSTVLHFPERERLTLDERISREVKALMGRYDINQMQLAAEHYVLAEQDELARAIQGLGAA